MTARATLDSAIAAVRGAARDYLRKPFERAELFAAVDGCFEILELREAKRIADAQILAQYEALQRVNFALFRFAQSVDGGAAGDRRSDLHDSDSDRAIALMVVDEAGRVTWVDTGYLTLTAFESDEVVGRHLCEVAEDDIHPLIADALAGVYSAARIRLKKAGSGSVTVTLTSIPVYDPDRRFRGICALVSPETGSVPAALAPLRSSQRIAPQESADPASGTPAGLTDRQRDVLGRALGGGRAGDIAKTMELSEHTVRSHLKAIYRKLGVRSRVELVARFGRLRSAGPGQPV